MLSSMRVKASGQRMGPLSGNFFLDILSIILIDVLLAGDNAVLIALAVKSLPPAQRKIGIAAGAGGAVVLRVILTFFAAQMLQWSFLKLIGGLFILWIAVKLLTENGSQEHDADPVSGLRHAIWLILVADITMSIDNILAVAAASKGNPVLLILGLGLSITFVVFASSLLANIMDRYPVVIWIGSAILGRVGAGMIVGDPWFERQIHLTEPMKIAAQVVCAAGVLAAGRALSERKKKGKNPAARNV
jgi:YjbE family integral membrane protein